MKGISKERMRLVEMEYNIYHLINDIKILTDYCNKMTAEIGELHKKYERLAAQINPTENTIAVDTDKNNASAEM